MLRCQLDGELKRRIRVAANKASHNKLGGQDLAWAAWHARVCIID